VVPFYSAVVVNSYSALDSRIAATHVGLCKKSEYEGDIKAVLNE